MPQPWNQLGSKYEFSPIKHFSDSVNKPWFNCHAIILPVVTFCLALKYYNVQGLVLVENSKIFSTLTLCMEPSTFLKITIKEEIFETVLEIWCIPKIKNNSLYCFCRTLGLSNHNYSVLTTQVYLHFFWKQRYTYIQSSSIQFFKENMYFKTSLIETRCPWSYIINFLGQHIVNGGCAYVSWLSRPK